MDYSSLINGALDVLWLGFPVLVLLLALKLVLSRSRGLKGMAGEAGVQLQARLRLPKRVYHRFHGVTLRTRDGSTQVDHVFVSRFGVFVVETKNMRGWIFGREDEWKWTQRIFGNSFRFQNPLRQNHKHVAALQGVLGVPPDVVHSVVVFTRRCRFKTPMPANVCRGGAFIDYIKLYWQPALSQAQVQEAIARLRSARLPVTGGANRRHVENVKSRSKPNAVRRCPRCGSRMTIRTAKRGPNTGRKFWGCSAYPKCRMVQDID